ncbi:MAG: NYN domain-containing protein [Ilumatobacteraceae bacterium]
MTADHPADDDATQVPDRMLLSALDFAVGIAAAGAKHRPPMPFPAGLRPFLRLQRLPPTAMASVRKAVEGDPLFRQRLGAVVVADLVDEAGILWLQRPDGWVERLSALAPQPGELDTAAQLRRAEKRRVAAEQAAHRALAEVVTLRADHDRRADSAAAADTAVVGLRRELDAARTEGPERQRQLRRTTDQLAWEMAALAELEAKLAAADARAVEAEHIRDRVLGERAGGPSHALAEIEPSRLSQRAAAAVPERPARRWRVTKRRPIALPGGVYGSSTAAAEFLVRHAGVVVVVDGYNVAKLGWPRLSLEQQREQCVTACEEISRRFGTDVVVVFDGASITGAAASQRRLVRVRFSSEGVTADDVIRDEVAVLPDTASVVVATNDLEVVGDVRAMGANVLTSEQLLTLGRR